MSYTPFVGANMHQIVLDKRTSEQYEKPTKVCTVTVTYASGSEVRLLGRRKAAYCYQKTKRYGIDCWKVMDSSVNPTFLFESEATYKQMLQNKSNLNTIEGIISKGGIMHNISTLQIEEILKVLGA